MKKRNQIKEYKKNEQLDLEKIMDEYHGYVHKIIYNMAGTYLSKEDIEEILSDTFFILWKNRGQLKEEDLLSAYIAGIVRNLVKEKIRATDKKANLSDYENILLDEIKIDMLYEQREMISMIKKIVEKRKDVDIAIFKLYYGSSKRISEIAKILEISEFNIKSRLYRMRKQIKKEMEKGGYSIEK